MVARVGFGAFGEAIHGRRSMGRVVGFAVGRLQRTQSGAHFVSHRSHSCHRGHRTHTQIPQLHTVSGLWWTQSRTPPSTAPSLRSRANGARKRPHNPPCDTVCIHRHCFYWSKVKSVHNTHTFPVFRPFDLLTKTISVSISSPIFETMTETSMWKLGVSATLEEGVC